MGQITAPIIAITLVLLRFRAVGFIPGLTGELYKQFAVAVSVSMLFSAINALTFSPAFAPFCSAASGPRRGPMRYVLAGIDRMCNGYAGDRGEPGAPAVFVRRARGGRRRHRPS